MSTRNCLPELPASVAEIADVIGRDAALRLVGALPPAGSRSWRRVVYVPKRLKPGHPLIDMVGLEAAQALARHFAGAVVQPGACADMIRAWNTRHLRRLAAEGWPADELAEAFGLSARQVRNLAPDVVARRSRPRATGDRR